MIDLAGKQLNAADEVALLLKAWIYAHIYIYIYIASCPPFEWFNM